MSNAIFPLESLANIVAVYTASHGNPVKGAIIVAELHYGTCVAFIDSYANRWHTRPGHDPVVRAAEAQARADEATPDAILVALLRLLRGKDCYVPTLDELKAGHDLMEACWRNADLDAARRDLYLLFYNLTSDEATQDGHGQYLSHDMIVRAHPLVAELLVAEVRGQPRRVA